MLQFYARITGLAAPLSHDSQREDGLHLSLINLERKGIPMVPELERNDPLLFERSAGFRAELTPGLPLAQMEAAA